MRPAERAAATIAEHTLSRELDTAVVLEWWDNGTQQDGWPTDGRHDYWLGPARWGAFEVTTIADQALWTAEVTWSRTLSSNPHAQVDGLTQAYFVSSPTLSHPRDVLPTLTTSLPEVEAKGGPEPFAEHYLTDFFASQGTSTDRTRSAHHRLAKWISAGHILINPMGNHGQPGDIWMATVSDVPARPANDPNHLVTVIEQAFTLDRHQKDVNKLDRSGVPERHLFFWASPTRWDAVRALDEGPPSRPPNLPVGITAVWIAFNEHHGYWWTGSRGWQPIQPAKINQRTAQDPAHDPATQQQPR